MRRIISKLDQSLHALLWVLAFTLIPLAVVVGLGRELFPHIADQKAWLEQTIAERTGLYVRIADLEGSWPAMTPVLSATSIELFHPDDPEQVLLSIPSLSVQPDWFASLRSLSPRLAIMIDGLTLTLVQGSDGSLQVREFERLGSADPSGAERSLRWLLAQPKIQLNHSQLHWETDDKPSQLISDIKVQQQSSPKDYRMMTEFRLGDSVAQQRLIFQVQGDPLAWRNQSWKAYFDIEDLTAWQNWQYLMPEPWQAKNLSGAAKVWLSAERGKLPRLSLVLDKVAAVLEFPDYGRYQLKDLSGVLQGELERPLWRLRGDRLTGLLNNQALPLRRFVITHDEQGLELALAQVQLKPVVTLVTQHQLLPAAITEQIQRLQPTGTIPRLRVHLAQDAQGDWQWQQASAEFKALSFNKMDKWPAVTDLAGWLDATPDKGIAYIDSHRASIDLHTVFREPVSIRSLSGGLRWFRDDAHWHLDTGVLNLVNSDAAGHAQLSLRIPTDMLESPRLELVARLNRGQVQQAYRYVPWPPAGDGTLAWLQKALQAGEVVNGDFVFSGELGAKATLPAHFEMSLPVRGARLDYVEGWPALQAVNGVVSIRDKELVVVGTSANIMSAKATQLRAEIADLSKAVLKINTHLDMDLSDLQRLLSDSPLAKTTAEVAKVLSLQGPAKASLDLTIPFSNFEPIVQVDATLSGASVNLPNQRLQYTDVSGAVSFDSRSGLRSDDLKGRLLGQEAELTLRGDSHRGKWVQQQVGLRGSTDMVALSNWLKLPLSAHLTGVAAFTAEVDIPLTGSASTELDVYSELKGVSSTMPAPLAKAANTVLPFRYQSRIGSVNDRARLSLGDIAQARLNWRDADLHSVVVAVGRNAPRLPSEGFTLLIDVDTFNVNAWYDYIQSKKSGVDSGIAFNKVQLNANEALLGKQWVDGLSLEVDLNAEQGWQLRLQSAKLRSLPVLPELTGAAMIKRSGHNWQADPVSVRVGDTSFAGSMLWRDRGPVMTRLQGQVQGADVGKVLTQFAVPPFIESDSVQVELNVQWPGHPEDWDMSRLKGSINAELKKGRLKEAGGINLLTRGFGLLNAGNLMRRLKLDFTDVTKKGLNYDRIILQGELNNGVANPAGFDLTGPTVNVRGKGWADLNRQTLEQDLRVDVPVSSAVPLVAGFLAGPVIGGALVAADILLDKQLSKVTSLRYRVSGPWSDLKLDDERLEGVVDAEAGAESP